MTAAELQSSIAQKLAQAGTPATSVNCPKDLPGEVGATTRCEVRFSPSNAVTAILTTTQVSGDQIDWEFTSGELTKDQLADRVTALAGAQAVTCESGVDGHVDAWSRCQIKRVGSTSSEIAEVRSTNGLMIDVILTRSLPRPEVEKLLLQRVPPQPGGRRPVSATCVGDLAGIAGAKTECSVDYSAVPGGEALTISYELTTTTVTDGAINFDFVANGAAGGDPNIDYCIGCPG